MTIVTGKKKDTGCLFLTFKNLKYKFLYLTTGVHYLGK